MLETALVGKNALSIIDCDQTNPIRHFQGAAGREVWMEVQSSNSRTRMKS
jgi:hypothetical protein